jgi:hypothetical protein
MIMSFIEWTKAERVQEAKKSDRMRGDRIVVSRA